MISAPFLSIDISVMFSNSLLYHLHSLFLCIFHYQLTHLKLFPSILFLYFSWPSSIPTSTNPILLSIKINIINNYVCNCVMFAFVCVWLLLWPSFELFLFYYYYFGTTFFPSICMFVPPSSQPPSFDGYWTVIESSSPERVRTRKQSCVVRCVSWSWSSNTTTSSVLCLPKKFFILFVQNQIKKPNHSFVCVVKISWKISQNTKNNIKKGIGSPQQTIKLPPISADDVKINNDAVDNGIKITRKFFTNKTKAIVWGMQQRAVQSMLDFDFICR